MRETAKKELLPICVILTTILIISVFSMTGCQTNSPTAPEPTATLGPANLISSITAFPNPVAQSSNLTVTMIVSNTGGHTANAVTPIGWGIQGNVVWSHVSGPVPTNITITGETAGIFTWVFTPASIGTMLFTANAQGTDADSGQTITSNVATSDIINVVPNDPYLVSWINVNPGLVNINQRYTVIMSVSNVGVVDANATTANTSVNHNPEFPQIQITSPSPNNADILVGGYYAFTWVYEATGDNGGPSLVEGVVECLGFSSIDITCCNTNSITSQP